MKLYVGCDITRVAGWINIDIEPSVKPDLVHDATKPFPYANDSIDFISSEHFIEHISAEGGVAFFREAYRMLKPGGVIRTATFDLDELMYNLRGGNEAWKEDLHIAKLGLGGIQTRAEYMNISMRWWGHQYVYNLEELTRRLKEAGFININICEFRKSNYPELMNIENRPESDLILEAIK